MKKVSCGAHSLVVRLLSKLRHREVNDLPTEVEIAGCLGRRDES